MESSGEVELRRFRGERDLPGMTALINTRVLAEGEGQFATVAELAGQYQHLQRCDAETDIVVADRGGAVVGYGHTMWDDVSEGHRVYWLIVEADPSVAGLERRIADWVEQRALAIAATHDVADRRLTAEAYEGSHRARRLAEAGFQPETYSTLMVRPHLGDVPVRPLPAGLALRPVDDSHLRQIWEADIEAMRDHRGFVEQTEDDWAQFLAEIEPQDRSLWQVAWDGDRVAAQVRTVAIEEEIRRIGRQRAWTEDISTRREWRGRGAASALICASLRQLAVRGFTEAALGVDTENPSRALALYRSLGYEQRAMWVQYERHIDRVTPRA